MGHIHTGKAARAIVGVCLAVVATSVAASPAWAGSRSPHRAPSTTSTTLVTTTTSTATLPSPAPPPAEPEDTCVRGAWPSAVEGRPTQFEAGNNGAYLWHDPDGGWALRVTHSGPHDRAIFSGSLTSFSGQFVDVSLVNDNGNDIVAVSPNKHVIDFRFVNYGLMDGLNFATQCARAFTVDIHEAGRLVPPGTVYLGAALVNPTSNPFRVERQRDAAAAEETGAATTTTPASSTRVRAPEQTGVA